jgi:hypothetical protein
MDSNPFEPLVERSRRNHNKKTQEKDSQKRFARLHKKHLLDRARENDDEDWD